MNRNQCIGTMASEVKNRKHANAHKNHGTTSMNANPSLQECDKEFQTNERLQHDVLSDEPQRCRIGNDSAKSTKISAFKQQNGHKLLSTDDNNSCNLEKQNQERKHHQSNNNHNWKIAIELDLMAFLLFAVAFCTRVYRLDQPKNVVFDELHYGKYVSLYMKRIFYFDQHPPLGKQIIAGIASLVSYTGNYTFSRIGSEYTEDVPVFWLRLVPAICGSILAPCIYKLLLQMKLSQWTSLLGGILVIFDNALLTQSRFILMESMLLLFSILAILFLLKFHEFKTLNWTGIAYGCVSAAFCAMAFSVKFVGFYTVCLCLLISGRFLWNLLPDKSITNAQLMAQGLFRIGVFTIVPISIYLLIFYCHLRILTKAGPHDSIMTSAFQASLEGGLASITKGQPLKVVHGSQITLRHTLGRTCWLHSHVQVYPVRYADKRGSSHQQQVTCYSFKDVNNWWIVKRPQKDDLVVGEESDPIRHGDEIHLIHGITSRALNSHDVAAPMTPQCQEISCYIDYNVSMPGQLIWKIDIINRDQEGPIWHAIKSQVRLIHVATGQALRFTGRQLPEWAYNQHEVVGDRILDQPDTIWNVEEHRYTKTEDHKERERQLINAEMIPTGPTILSFWHKFIELQRKMVWHSDQLQSHMYESQPHEWPLMSKGIAYWVDKDSNGQIHLLGNIAIWYSGTIAILVYCTLVVFYYLRRLRLCFDLTDDEWHNFCQAGELFLGGYFIHFLPYFCVERTLFLHNYFPALIYKILLLCFVIEHLQIVLRSLFKQSTFMHLYNTAICLWIATVIYVFGKFSVLSYGTTKLSADEVIDLRWKDTWDFILHRDFA